MSEAFNLPPVVEPTNSSNEELYRTVVDLVRSYNEIEDKFRNLPQVLVQGRTIQRVPSAFNDTIAGEFTNDTLNDSTGVYVLIDDSGTPKWGKITLDIAF